jgi:hypothetical protein
MRDDWDDGDDDRPRRGYGDYRHRDIRRRQSDGLPPGLIVGIVAGIAGFIVVIGVVLWVVIATLPDADVNDVAVDFGPQGVFLPPQNVPFVPPPGVDFAPPLVPPPMQPELPPPRVTGNADLDRILADMTGGDHFRRKAAVERLGGMTPPKEHRALIAQKLTEAAGDQDVFVRKAAVRALGRWATAKEIPTLIAALNHDDVFTRQEALNVIGTFRDKRTIAPVVECLRSIHTRSQAERALRDMGSMAEKAVLALLDDADVFVRQVGINMLRDIGTHQSVSALEREANGTNIFLRDPARAALQAIAARSKR